MRLVLVDADESVQFAVRAAVEGLANGWSLTCYPNADRALQSITLDTPDVVLMDICQPAFSGPDFIRRLRSLFPGLPVVVYTACPDVQCLLPALMAGACGYLMKPMPIGDLMRALADVAQGWPTLCRRAEKLLIQSLQTVGARNPASSLSPREVQIMSCLLGSFSDKEIGRALGIETGTAHVHVTNLFKKLDAHNRAEAVEKFLALG